jgi:glutamate-1-semialdehyde 2,1-aminomutase
MTRAEALYDRALRVTPWGTQTNAKRPDPAFSGAMPLFVERAEGCRLQDVDGRWFIDYRSALGPIILGYRHPSVETAVRVQMEKGVLFSMASSIEVEVAEALTGLIPGLEQVRFVKTGNDANASALRLARAFTGRDRIVVCGYHGSGDWFACGEGPDPFWFPRAGNGVPEALDPLVFRLPYGDTEAAEAFFAAHGHEVAALMMVPYNWDDVVAHTFVHRMRALTAQHGAVLVFDQVLTGFRLALRGAQEYFGVIPDLTTYAKALANGYPLAAYGGRRAIMAMLDRVVLTTTYAGETLSLAAAQATLGVLQSEPVLEHVWAMGTRLRDGFDALAARLGLPCRAFGLPPAVQFRFDPDPATDDALRRTFFAGLYRRGVFAARPFLLNYAHTPEVIDETLAVFEHALADVADAGIPRIPR